MVNIQYKCIHVHMICKSLVVIQLYKYVFVVGYKYCCFPLVNIHDFVNYRKIKTATDQQSVFNINSFQQ